MGLQRKRLLESLKSKGAFFSQTDLVCLYRQVENRPGRFPDKKKRLDITETGDSCLLSKMGSQVGFQLHYLQYGAALPNLVAPALWKEQVRFYKPFPTSHDTSDFPSFNPKDKLPRIRKATWRHMGPGRRCVTDKVFPPPSRWRRAWTYFAHDATSIISMATILCRG